MLYTLLIFILCAGADQIHSTTERLLPGARDRPEIFTQILGVRILREIFSEIFCQYFFTDTVMRCPTVCLKQPSRRSWKIVSVLQAFTMKAEPTPWR